MITFAEIHRTKVNTDKIDALALSETPTVKSLAWYLKKRGNYLKHGMYMTTDSGGGTYPVVNQNGYPTDPSRWTNFEQAVNISNKCGEFLIYHRCFRSTVGSEISTIIRIVIDGGDPITLFTANTKSEFKGVYTFTTSLYIGHASWTDNDVQSIIETPYWIYPTS